MPRIDPLQLLKCLSVLLSPEGGIMSREEVPRLVNLMTKFSKKLVSKCVYLLILKSTDVTLVDMFMASGGWLLIQTWLQEAMASSNWNLVQEVLELLLITPVESSRLRLNNIPKLVKTLSKREDLGDVKEMAASLVNNWLAIVKSSTLPVQESEKPLKPSEASLQSTDMNIQETHLETNGEVQNFTNEIETVELSDLPTVEEDPVKMEVEDENAISTGMFYKITVRDGKQVITKLATTEEVDEKQAIDEIEATPENVESRKEDIVIEKVEEDIKENKSKKDEIKSRSGSSSSSSKSSSGRKTSSSSKSSSSSSSSKDKDRRHSSSSKHSSKSSSSSSSRDKEKERDKSRKDKDKENEKDKHRSNGSIKHSSSSNKSSSSSSSISTKDRDKTKNDTKEPKEKQAEKDKDTLAKLKPATLDKLGRIPKKNTSSEEKEKEVLKKPSMSIETKKKGEERPKTVKIFNSKMRSTGLEEEAKPPPPRNAVKKPPPALPPVLPFPAKRTSPPRDPVGTPPEKKLKIEMPERAGSIKLIPPKPKPAVLLESDIFMDALTAATSKKEPKKRKRKLSISKESPENSPTIQPPGATSPLGLKNFAPANFYQDNAASSEDADESKEKIEEAAAVEENTSDDNVEVKKEKPVAAIEESSDISEPTTRTNSDGLRGVLVYAKRKGPKKSIKWKEEKDLVEIRYFELDETERVNVSRPNFTDMAKLEMTNEREALMGRKLMNEDLMEPTTLWIIPYIVDQPELPVQPGSRSLEKDIQYAREKNILQALYFNRSLIPDTPGEPIPETHPMVDPVSIPLEDSESQVYDLRNTQWPEPKGMAPVEQPPVNAPPMFQNIPGPFPSFPQMPPQGFPPMQAPGFCPPNMLPNGPPNMMPNNMNMMGNPNMPMGPPMDMMNQGPMTPNMFVPGVQNMENFNPMMNENPNFQMNQMNFNPPNMYGPPTNNFNMDRGGHNRGRGNFNRGHNRMNNNNNWGRNSARGGVNWRNTREDHRGGTGRICKNIKNHGYCRNIENCPFVHPN